MKFLFFPQRVFFIFVLAFSIFFTAKTRCSELNSSKDVDDIKKTVVLVGGEEEDGISIFEADENVSFYPKLGHEQERTSLELDHLLNGNESECDEEGVVEFDFDSLNLNLSSFIKDIIHRKSENIISDCERDSLVSFSIMATSSNLNSSNMSTSTSTSASLGHGRFYSVCNTDVIDPIHARASDFLLPYDDDSEDDVVSIVSTFEEEEEAELDVSPEILDQNNLTISWIIEVLILEKVQEVLMKEQVVHFIGVNCDETLVLVGDIHGQYDDLIRIFTQFGYPSEKRKFIFNGDIIDRGTNSMGCLLLLLTLKIALPESVFITRGNHETKTCNGHGIFTYQDECYKMYPNGNQNFNAFFEHSHQVFTHLPLAFIINGLYFVCHGGIPDKFDLKTFVQGFDQFKCTESEYKNFYALLWNDPHNGEGMKASDRGEGTLCFGESVTRDFLTRHNLSLLIRSHQYCTHGFIKQHNDRCITIFSAPNYCGIGNAGAVMIIKSNLLFSLYPHLSYQIFPINTEIEI